MKSTVMSKREREDVEEKAGAYGMKVTDHYAAKRHFNIEFANKINMFIFMFGCLVLAFSAALSNEGLSLSSGTPTPSVAAINTPDGLYGLAYVPGEGVHLVQPGVQEHLLKPEVEKLYCG